MKNGLFLLDPKAFDLIYGPAEREDIARLVRLYVPPQSRQSVTENPGVLTEAEVIFSGWGMAVMDEAFFWRPHRGWRRCFTARVPSSTA